VLTEVEVVVLVPATEPVVVVVVVVVWLTAGRVVDVNMVFAVKVESTVLVVLVKVVLVVAVVAGLEWATVVVGSELY
jgi:hypothetical protein